MSDEIRDGDDDLGTELLPLLGDDVAADSAAEDGLELDDHQSHEIRQIFRSALPQYVQPVEEMVDQVLTGAADGETLGALSGTLSSLGLAALRMGFEEVHALLEALGKNVERCEADTLPPPKVRDAILADLLRLTEFAAHVGTQAERSPTIFAALSDVDDIGVETLGRLSAAGLLTIDQLAQARPDEVAAVSGLDMNSVVRLMAHVEHARAPATPAPSDSADTGAARPSARKRRATGMTPPWPLEDRADDPHDDGHGAAASRHDAVTADAPRSDDKAGDDVHDAANLTVETDDDENIVDLPLDLDALRRATTQRIEAQVDAEAAVGEVRAEVQRLRAQVRDARVQLDALASAHGEQRETLAALDREIARRTQALARARLAQQGLLQDCLSSEQEVQRQHDVLVSLRREHAGLRDEEQSVHTQMRGLVERLGRVRRVAAGKIGKPST